MTTTSIYTIKIPLRLRNKCEKYLIIKRTEQKPIVSKTLWFHNLTNVRNEKNGDRRPPISASIDFSSCALSKIAEQLKIFGA